MTGVRVVSVMLTDQELLRRLTDNDAGTRFEITTPLEHDWDDCQLELLGPRGERGGFEARLRWRKRTGAYLQQVCLEIGAAWVPFFRDWVVATLSNGCPAPPRRRADAFTEATTVVDVEVLARSHSAKEHAPQSGDVIGGKYVCQQEVWRSPSLTMFLANRVALAKSLMIVIGDDTRSTPVVGDAFLRHAKTLAKLDIQGVPTVFDFGIDPRFGPFYAMEHLNGASLRCFISGVRSRGVSDEEKVDLVLATLTAAHSLHHEGMLHGTLRPDNVWVQEDTTLAGTRRTAKILILADPAEADSQTSRRSPADDPYRAPEQCCGQPPHLKSDLYSLGIISFELLTGLDPRAMMMYRALGSTLPTRGDTSRAFWPTLRRLAAFRPEERPDSIAQVYDELRAVAMHERVPCGRKGAHELFHAA